MEKDYSQREHLPQQIGPYKVEALLARGGMSLVFLGHEPLQPNRKVVLKVLLPEYVQDKKVNACFLNEAKILAKVYHPNIPKIYKVGEWEHGIFLAIEYFQGISLRGFINKQSFSLDRALEIILNIGYALYHLHSHGVVHRDLKPENVILTEEGEVKVIDFSLSQLIPEDRLEHMLEESYRAGTTFYMSPEQRDHPKLVTKATDIYALGIIAFELILGRSTYGLIQTFLLPQGLRQIVEKAIQILPDSRYADIFDFIHAITEYRQSLKEGKEEREASGGPLREMLDRIHSILVPSKPPAWPHVSISMATQAGMAISAPYLDFFHQTLFLASPLQMGLESLFHTFALRGMVRLEADNHNAIGAEALERICKALYMDPMDQKFGACSLTFAPKKVVFCSCQFVNLWQISKGKLIEHSTAANRALGHPMKGPLQEVEILWEPNDVFVLYSHPFTLTKERKEAILKGSEAKAEHLIRALAALSPTSEQKETLLILLRCEPR